MHELKRRPRRLGATPTEVMPTDNYGMPLPIVDDLRVKDVYKSNPKHAERNQHHSWFEADRPEIRMSLAGRALRASRVEYMREIAHNQAHEIFLGPDMPDPLVDIGKEPDMYGEWHFRRIVLSAAGYQPNCGIDVFSSKPGSVKLVETRRLRSYQALGQLGFENPRFKRGEILENRHPLGEFTLHFLMNFIEDDVYDYVFEPAKKDKRKKQLRRVQHVADRAVRDASGLMVGQVHKAVRSGRIERRYGQTSRELSRQAILSILNYAYPLGQTRQGGYRDVDYRSELLELIHQEAVYDGYEVPEKKVKR